MRKLMLVTATGRGRTESLSRTNPDSMTPNRLLALAIALAVCICPLRGGAAEKTPAESIRAFYHWYMTAVIAGESPMQTKRREITDSMPRSALCAQLRMIRRR